MKRESRMLTREEYIAEMTQRFGEQGRNWKCQCPICGLIYRIGDCGTDSETAERGLFSCIGRITGKGGTAFGETPPNEHGCNFTANGLFMSPWKLRDAGKEFGIMPIAPVEDQTTHGEPRA